MLYPDNNMANKNIFTQFSDWIDKMEASFVSHVTSDKYNRYEKWMDESDPETKKKANKPSAPPSPIQQRKSEEIAPSYIINLSHREVLRRARKNIKVLSGINWLYLTGGCILISIILPWLPSRHSDRESGDYSFFDFGDYLVEGNLDVMFYVALGIAVFAWLTNVGPGKGGGNGFKDHMNSYLQKDHPDWDEYKCDTIGEELAEANRPLFVLTHFHSFLGTIVFSYALQILLHLLSLFLPLGLFNEILMGILITSVFLASPILYIYFKKAIARVVYDEWKGEPTETASNEFPEDSYQK